MSYHVNDHLILEYVNEQNVSPFALWFSTIDDITAERVRTAISRIEIGNFANCKSLGKGLWEIKLVFGAGIRVYFGKRANRIILLWGGDKNRQTNDITRAYKYWVHYLKTVEYIQWH